MAIVRGIVRNGPKCETQWVRLSDPHKIRVTLLRESSNGSMKEVPMHYFARHKRFRNSLTV